ncbi:MAG: hypothetical protein SGCHY_003757, partial [Lobulomycetales sp.]
EAKYTAQEVRDARKFLEILILFTPLPLFWALYDQQSSRWTAQALRLQNTFSLGAGRVKITVPPDSMQTVNAVLVLVFIPVFQRWVYPGLQRVGVSLAPARKIVIGMLLVAASFLVAAVLQYTIEAGAPKTVPIYWQVPQYVILTAGEVFFSITGLEFAYAESPPSMKSMCQSAWQLTVALGNLIVIVIAESNFKPADELVFFAFLLCCAAVLFSLLSFRYQKVQSYQAVPADDEDAEEDFILARDS